MSPTEVLNAFRTFTGDDCDEADLIVLMLRFMASLDNHRGVDLDACLKEWLREQTV